MHTDEHLEPTPRPLAKAQLSTPWPLLVAACAFGMVSCLVEPEVRIEIDGAGGAVNLGGSGGGGVGGEPTPTPEMCNGLDDDLDGTTDEGLTAPPATLAVGVCQGAVQICDGANGWREPDLADTPDYETDETRCDALDNDCDGRNDESLDRVCGVTEGECTQGTTRCVEGVYSACEGGLGPRNETCDALDNDCNGEVDDQIDCECVNGQQQVCGTDVGLCEEGLQVCADGRWGACEGSVTAVDEECNDQDDDCDGQIDDSIGAIETECGVGECAAQGAMTCQGGEMLDNCRPRRPVAESCDGRDNDCDGLLDEGDPESGRDCVTGLMGICAPGQTTCRDGRVECDQNVPAQAPACGDNTDHDCDGDVDEFRNECNDCGDRYEAGTSCDRCYTLRSARDLQVGVTTDATIDVVGDEDFYCFYMGDDIAVPNQEIRLTLSNPSPFERGFNYQLNLYRSVADCNAGDSIFNLDVPGRRSGLGFYSEGPNDLFARAINDSGTYIVKITADGAQCENTYRFHVGVFQAP